MMCGIPPIFPPSPALGRPQTSVFQGFGSLGAFSLDRSHAQEGGVTRPRVSTHILPSSHYIKKSLKNSEIEESPRQAVAGRWEDHP